MHDLGSRSAQTVQAFIHRNYTDLQTEVEGLGEEQDNYKIIKQYIKNKTVIPGVPILMTRPKIDKVGRRRNQYQKQDVILVDQEHPPKGWEPDVGLSQGFVGLADPSNGKKLGWVGINWIIDNVINKQAKKEESQVCEECPDKMEEDASMNEGFTAEDAKEYLQKSRHITHLRAKIDQYLETISEQEERLVPLILKADVGVGWKEYTFIDDETYGEMDEVVKKVLGDQALEEGRKPSKK